MDQEQVTLWLVKWRAMSGDKILTSRCAVGATSNKITTLADVPKMIAIKNGLVAEEIVLISLVNEAEEAS